MKLRLPISFLVAACLGWISPALAAPVVTNLAASQRTGTQLVDIAYDVAAPGFPSVAVSLQISSDGGATWTVPTGSASGDISIGIVPGTGKDIVWDAGADWAGNYSAIMLFRVVAYDGVTEIPGFAYILGGSSTMGSTSGDIDHNAPPIAVTVSPFYVAETETTKALWDEVRTWAVANGYTDLEAGAGKGANHPVHTVSWYNVVKWCNAWSEKEGLTPVYTVGGMVTRTGTTEPEANWSANGYRLPTEAEWEKAARGRVSGKRFPWGTDTISHIEANFLNTGVEAYATGTTGSHPAYNYATTGETPHTSPVGSFAANGYGLMDMAGNVWEWCWDRYGSRYYTTSNGTTDPRGPAIGDRVYRGGSWSDGAFSARCSNRVHATPGSWGYSLGFRTVRSKVSESYSGSAETGDVMVDTRSDNAHLSSLALSSGTLSPALTPGNTTYTASVGNATTSITVTPTRAQANATIDVRVNGGAFAPVTSGSPSGSLSLNVGSNTIDIRVTAQAGNTQTHTITVTRDKAAQTIIFSNPGPRVANTTFNLSATGGGSGNPVTFTAEGPAQINGSNVLSFTGTGSVTVRANQGGNANYHPAAEVAHAFTVTVASATVTLGGLAQTYDGTLKTATASTNPPGVSHSLVHDPATSVNAGSYGVTATVTDPRYAGSATDTLVIAKASQTITFGAIADQLTTTTVNLSATGGGSGNPVTFSVTGPAQIDGINAMIFTGPGAVTVRANQVGNANYKAAPELAHTFIVSISATVTLSELHQVADGTARTVTVTTVPPDLAVAITYAGNSDAPTAPGSYAVVATITDPLYDGSANGTLVVDDPAMLILVNGGQLPALSALGALDVETYQIARYEVTRGLWNTVRDWAIANGYDLSAIGVGSAGDYPVHSLNWYDAIKWCNARTEWENATFGRSLAPVYRIGSGVYKTGEPDPATILLDEGKSGYRLPTAKEWEFAARGGTLGTGKTYSGSNDPDLVAWNSGNSAGAALDLSGGRGTWPAGRKATNELGLYDLSGNVAEWTQGANPENASTRYVLGGSWNAAASESAIGALNSAAPMSRLNTTGFRVARSVASAMAGALDNDELTWNSGGDAPWFAQTGTTHDTTGGIDAAESGALGQDEENWVETTVTGPGNLSFHWKSASVDGADVLRFSIGTSETASLTGTVDWQEKTFEIPEGDSVLRWRFARTSPATAGTSRVWLDEVVYTLATEPELTTAPATEVTETTATLGGEVTDEGGRDVTARGVVYATTTAPTLANSVANAANGGTGVFTASGTNLVPGTTFHARAYATNTIGTGYGPEITFTTGESATFNNGVATFTRSILPGGRQVFNFTLTGPRIVSLSTQGGAALRAELFDSVGNLIASFEIGAELGAEELLLAAGVEIPSNANFDLEKLLLAGDYSLHVLRGEDGGPAQTFDLTINASVVAASRPDVEVGTSAGTLTGRSVYSPASQLASLTSRKLRAVTGYASVSNLGNLPDMLAVSGGRGSAFFKVVWSDLTGNVTAALSAGSYRTAEMEEGTTPVSLTATITPNKKKLTKTNKKTRRATIVKKTFVLPLRAGSTFAPATSDAGTIQVKTK